MTSPAFAIAMIIVTGAMLAGMDVIAKFLAVSFPVLFVIWGRYFFQTIITFAAYAGQRRSIDFLVAKRPGLQFFRALSLFGATCTLYVAITMMPLGDAAAIQFMAPVLVTLLSGVFLGEHVGPRRLAAVFVAFVGVLLIARPGSGVFGWVVLLPVATAILLAIYMMMTRIIRSQDDPASTTFYSTAVGTIVLSAVAPFYWQSLGGFDWMLMVAMGAAGAAGHFLWVKAFAAAEASMLAPFTYSQVVAAIAWGWLVFGDVPSIWTISGATLIVGSGLFVWYRETHQGAAQ